MLHITLPSIMRAVLSDSCLSQREQVRKLGIAQPFYLSFNLRTALEPFAMKAERPETLMHLQFVFPCSSV